MLTTNMVRKDLNSQNMFDAAVAINGLSCFMTTDLARDLVNDIMALVRNTLLPFFAHLMLDMLLLQKINVLVLVSGLRGHLL